MRRLRISYFQVIRLNHNTHVPIIAPEWLWQSEHNARRIWEGLLIIPTGRLVCQLQHSNGSWCTCKRQTYSPNNTSQYKHSLYIIYCTCQKLLQPSKHYGYQMIMSILDIHDLTCMHALFQSYDISCFPGRRTHNFPETFISKSQLYGCY